MSQPSQADLLAALQAQSSSTRKRPTTTGYADHADPVGALTTSASGSKVNATRIHCPREGCGSLILLDGAAEWIISEADAIPVEEKSPFTPTPALPDNTPNPDNLNKPGGYWYVRGGPMAFENVGYSRASDITLPPTAPGMSDGKKVKWLICAECDLGPVGWSCEGGNDSYLAVDRVRYGERK